MPENKRCENHAISSSLQGNPRHNPTSHAQVRTAVPLHLPFIKRYKHLTCHQPSKSPNHPPSSTCISVNTTSLSKNESLDRPRWPPRRSLLRFLYRAHRCFPFPTRLCSDIIPPERLEICVCAGDLFVLVHRRLVPWRY